MRAHHHVHPSSGRAYLYIRKVSKQGENQVQHLLVVPFVAGILAIGNGREHGLHQPQRPVHVIEVDAFRHLPYQRPQLGRTLHVVGEQAFHQPDAHFFVRNVQQVQLRERRIVLDGEVSALVEQGRDIGHTLGRSIEIAGFALPSAYCLRNNLVLVEHFYQVGGCSASEPERFQFAFVQCSQQTVGVIDIGRGPCEVIAVIVFLQPFHGLFLSCS